MDHNPSYSWTDFIKGPDNAPRIVWRVHHKNEMFPRFMDRAVGQFLGQRLLVDTKIE